MPHIRRGQRSIGRRGRLGAGACALALLALGCGSAAASVAAAPGARGLVSADAAPPAGAELAEAPAWQVGDSFTFRRGGSQRIATRVIVADDAGYRLQDEGSGVVLRYTRELHELGQEHARIGEAAVALAPADRRYEWPLWVGKRWVCEFTAEAAGQEPRTILASYECDALETLTVPAGTFRCYRVWRRARAAANERATELVAVTWYAPEVGHFVRRVENSVMLELESAPGRRRGAR